MSTSFVWRPIVPPPPIEGGVNLATWVLLNEHLGYVHYDETSQITLSGRWVDWLAGVRDGSPDGEVKTDVQDLLTAIAEHGQIVITVER